MPELPEAEITVRKLRPLIKGRRILPVGEKILDLERKGKAIILRLSGGKILAFHQRMTGKLFVVDRDFKDKYIRRRFKLSNGRDLVFHDVRRFGVVWYGTTKKVFEDQYFSSLGADALAVSFQSIKNLLSVKRKQKIKAWLLDQKNIAGVGNIMADEILWKAKIHPERKISSLKDSEIKILWRSLRSVLKKSIKLGGSTMRDWFHPDGEGGGYFERRQVYDREGKNCLRCRNKIIKYRVAGRGTYFCGRCQKNSPAEAGL